MSDPLLLVEDVSLNFGGTKALEDVSFEVKAGEVLGMIGPNGAGKTSMLNCLNAVVRPQKGSITFEGQQLVGRQPHEIVRLGIGRTFQGPSLQPNATVAENVLSGRDFMMKYGLFEAAAYWGRASREEARHRLAVEEILEFLHIQHIRDVPAASLPWGSQRLVDIGRALAAKPRLILLDEPTSGMTYEEKQDVADCIVRMQRDLGLSAILIEHDARFVADLCNRIVALDFGRVMAAGSPDKVLGDPRVAAAYLGTVEQDASLA